MLECQKTENGMNSKYCNAQVQRPVKEVIVTCAVVPSARGYLSKGAQVSENVIHFRNATLELLSDGKDRNFQSAQLNNW